MKTITLLALTTLLSSTVFAQGHWEWIVSFGGSNYETGYSLLLHPNGSLYCTARFNSGFFILGDTTVVEGYAQSNALLCQYDLNGNLIKRTVGREAYLNPDPKSIGFGRLLLAENQVDYYMVMGATGDCRIDTIYISGSYGTSYLTKWNTDAKLVSLTPQNVTDCSGDVMYGAGFEVLYKGCFYGSSSYGGSLPQNRCVCFDSICLGNPDSLYVFSEKAVLVKADTTGNFKFAKQVLGGKRTRLEAMEMKNGRASFLGISDSCFVFDTIHVCAPLGKGVESLFQVDTNGSVLWSKMIYSASNAYGITAMLADDEGSLYALGSFDSTLYVGSDTFYKNSPTWNTFLAKFNSTGNLLWLKQFYSTDGFLGHFTSAIVKNDKFYMAGSFSGSMVLCGDTITAESSSDMFIARFDTAGNCIGVVTVPNASVAGFVEDSAGNVYVTGAVYGTADIAFDETTVMPQGNGDFFLAKLSAIVSSSRFLKTEDNLLTIYANPNQGNFTVQVPESLHNATRIQLGVYDNTGKTIKEEHLTVTDNKLAIDLGAVTKGIYTVTLTSGQRKFTGRVVVE
ncbi:MAG: T9SS type A sorting domain-containing protein [Chitinophagales bacterium]|nr:T9SS type A sorting domain-containing protein [Chitinophagales bacterium]